ASVFEIDRSAWRTTAATVVPAVSLLLTLAGSKVVAATVALLLMGPLAPGAVTWIVIPGADPTASDARVHVTVPDAWPQLHPVPLAETNPTPEGSVSVTVRDAPVLGPAF